MIKAVIFDMWNTLIHMERKVDFLEGLWKAMGVDIDLEQFAEMYHKSLETKKWASHEVMFKAFCVDFGIIPKPDIVKKLVDAYRDSESEIKFYHDAIHTLLKVRGKYKIGLLSNVLNLAVDEAKHLEIEKYFDAVLYSFEVRKVKPHLDMFLTMLGKLGVKADEAVMVGDSEKNDIMPAKSLGMKTIHIKRVGEKSGTADYCVASLEEIHGILEKMESI